MKSRRLLATAAVASVAALALAGCAQKNPGTSSGGGGDETHSKKTLTVFISADTNVQSLWEDSLIPAFEKANPGYKVKVNLDLHGKHNSQTIAKLTSATKQGKDPGFDLIDAGFVTQIAEAGLLLPVSEKNIPPLKTVQKNIIEAGQGGIPYRASSVLLAYNTSTVSNPPKTLDDMLAWIKAHPGKFTYNTPDSGGSGQSFVATVLDKYVPKADRKKMVTGYHQDLESEWDKGFQVLASLNPYIYQKGVYPNGNNQVLDLLSSGQIDMAAVWSDQFITGQKHGQIPKDISYTQISDPSFTGGAAYLGIPKTSPRHKSALKLANWLLTPDAQAIIAKSIAGYPVIDLSKLPSDVQKEFKKADPGNLRLPYFAKMNEDLNRLWAQKVPGK